MTEEQRIAIIKHAVENSKRVAPDKSLEDFISEVKSQEVLGEHGLFDVQVNDVEDEMSLIDYDPTAESIDEEDEVMQVSDEMKGVYK
jgi:hypothetical protein